MSDHEPEQAADEMEQRSQGLAEEIEDTRGEWQARKADRHVPGAVPDDKQHDEPEDEDPASFPSKTGEQ